MKRGQAWYIDYILATFIFVIGLIVYIEFESNISQEEEGTLNELVFDSETLTNNLMSEGVPRNWSVSDVNIPGLLSNKSLDRIKYNSFTQLNYDLTRYIFGTTFHFSLHFQDRDSNTIYIAKNCKAGNSAINSTLVSLDPVAYYYDTGRENHTGYYSGILNLHVYNESNKSAFLSGLEDYDTVIVEDPLLDDEDLENLTEFVQNGGRLFISGEILDKSSYAFLGNTHNSTPASTNATVIFEEEYLDLYIGDLISFDATPQIEAGTGSMAIANYSINSSAIVRTDFGSGTAYYLPSFSGIRGASLVEEILLQTLEMLVTGRCTDIDLESLDHNKLIKTERFMAFDSRIIKMVVYLWQ